MDKIITILKRKPRIFLILSLGYLVAVGVMKWHISPPLGALWFLVGGACGVYVLDIAEVFFALNPSPFHSPLFIVGFMLVSLFIATSSGTLLAQGLVLSLYATLLMRQLGERRLTGQLSAWYPQGMETIGFVIFVVVFIVETVTFIAWA